MSFGVFDIQFFVQGVEDIGELLHCLVPFMSQCGPSCLLVLIVSDRVIFSFKSIHKRFPSGFDSKHFIFLYRCLLIISLPPIFEMGDSLKEGESDLPSIVKILD